MNMHMGTGYLVLVAFLVACTLAGLDWLTAHNLSVQVYGGVGSVSALAMQRVSAGVKVYIPADKHDAKIANEKIRLLVNTLNALAVATIAAGVVVPFISDHKFPFAEVGSFIWLALGVYTHLKARGMLNYLKDEDAFGAVSSAQSKS